MGISQVDKQLEYVRVCLRIGIDCIDPNPAMRLATWRIIELLDELERSYGSIETDHCTSLAPHVSSLIAHSTPEMQSLFLEQLHSTFSVLLLRVAR